MTNADQLRALLTQCWDAPHGPGQVALVEQALALADALDDDHLRFETRMLATNAYQYGGEPVKGFVTFSWCLARYDARPDEFGHHEHSLLWQFKYMITSLTQFPEVPLQRAYAILDDMERRFRSGGHSLQAVYKYRYRVARHVGDDEATDRYHELWQAAPRDSNSDCRGCDPNSQISYLIGRDRDEEAIELSEPVLAGRLTCSEQPQSILTTLLLPYLRTGRLDEARAAHHKAYRAHRSNPANLHDIADHVYFCAMSGNGGAGLELIERHWSWLDRPPSPMAELEFCASASVVLSGLADAGYGEQQVRPAGRTIAVLADELAGRAVAIAQRFDTRNGTGHQGRLLAQKLAAAPIATELPLSLAAKLGSEVTRRDEPAEPMTVPAEESVDLLADVPAEADPDLIFDLAEEALRQDQETRAQALFARLVELAAERELTMLQQGRLADLKGMQLHGDDVEGTEVTWMRALDCYVAVGDVRREQRIRGRLGLHRCRHGQVESGLAEVRQSTEFLLSHGEPKDQAGALRRLAVALLHAELPAEALEMLDQLADITEPDPGPRVRLQVMLLRAQALGADGQLVASVDASRLLVEQATADGDRELIGLAEFFLGQGLSLLEDVPGAVDAFDRALGRPLPAELEREVRERRAVLLASSSRAGDVVDDLVRLVGRLTTERLTEESDHARFHLAVALFNTDRPADAAEVAEEALYGADRSGNQGLADQVRHLLATVYRRLDEPDQALSYLDQLAANLDGYDNAEGRARVLEQAGELLFELDRDGIAADRFGTAATAYALSGLQLDRLRALRRQMLAAMFADDTDQAMQALALADEGAAALPAALTAEPHCQYETAWLALDSARALVGLGDPESALARITPVPARFRELASFSEAFLADLTRGEILLSLGQPSDAEPVLREVVNGLPRDAAALPRAAYALAFALMNQGRTEEAQRLAAEYGFELD